MTEQQPSPAASVGSALNHARSACHELGEAVTQFLGVSPQVKEHLTNSRVEFLKAMRAVIDSRIENLSNQPQKGTRVAVE
jgi:hypothetical protein